jgi:hypothetical protein
MEAPMARRNPSADRDTDLPKALGETVENMVSSGPAAVEVVVNPAAGIGPEIPEKALTIPSQAVPARVTVARGMPTASVLASLLKETA